MAPRKAAAVPAVEDDGCPTLKLMMEKGPLSGQSNVYRPETRVQIGRVVRGNTLNIKDAGISTKHLLIQADPDASGRRRWTATDLGSSNGTILNGARLEPSEPTDLSDGDVIKIGEQTSITVAFEVPIAGEVEVKATTVRRNARRGVRKQVEDLGVIDEESELGLGIKNLGPVATNENYVDLDNECGELGLTGEGKPRGRRTRGSKMKEVENESKELGLTSEGKPTGRRTRGPKAKEVEKESTDEVKGPVNVNVSVRRTRSSRKEDNAAEPFIDLSVIESKRTRKGTRGKKNEHVETILVEKEKEGSNSEEQKVCEEEKVISEVGAEEGACLETENKRTRKGTRGKKNEHVETILVEKEKKGSNLEEQKVCEEEKVISEIGAEEGEALEKENIRTRKGTRGKKSEHVETISVEKENEESNLEEQKMCEEEKVISEVGAEEGEALETENKRTRKGTRGEKSEHVETILVEKENEESNLEEQKVCEEEKVISEVGAEEGVALEMENATEVASMSGVKEGGVETGNEVDLEKMTLGEWFDCLEVYLPKQIIDSTEEMLSEMRRKADKLHEFLSHDVRGMV